MPSQPYAQRTQATKDKDKKRVQSKRAQNRKAGLCACGRPRKNEFVLSCYSCLDGKSRSKRRVSGVIPDNLRWMEDIL